MSAAPSDSAASFAPLEGVTIHRADSDTGTEDEKSRYSAKMSDFGDTVDEGSELLSLQSPAASSISKSGVSWSEAEIDTVDDSGKSRMGQWFKEACSKSGSKTAAVQAASVLFTAACYGSVIYNQCVSGGKGN